MKKYSYMLVLVVLMLIFIAWLNPSEVYPPSDGNLLEINKNILIK